LENSLHDYLKHIRENARKSADIVELVRGKIQTAREFLPTRKVVRLMTQDFKTYREREAAAGVAHSTINYRFALVRAALSLETKQTPSRVGKVPYILIVHVNNTREGFLD
jgi:hypothetical protein